MEKFAVRGATDITGFGLAGHALKMARASKVTIEIEMARVPLIGDTYSLIEQGCIPGASFRNLEYAENETVFSDTLNYNLKMAAFDAQTSGGLLIALPEKDGVDLLAGLKEAGLDQSAIIGRVMEKGSSLIVLK